MLSSNSRSQSLPTVSHFYILFKMSGSHKIHTPPTLASEFTHTLIEYFRAEFFGRHTFGQHQQRIGITEVVHISTRIIKRLSSIDTHIFKLFEMGLQLVFSKTSRWNRLFALINKIGAYAGIFSQVSRLVCNWDLRNKHECLHTIEPR